MVLAFRKYGSTSPFDFQNSSWEQNMFDMWKQSINSSSVLNNMQDATQRMFESIGQTIQKNWKGNPYFEQAEQAMRQNSHLFGNKNYSEYSQAMVEINKIAMCMVQSIMQMQQQYLCQVFQKMGQIINQKYDPDEMNPRQKSLENIKDFSDKAAKYFASLSNTMMQANQEIYEQFLNVCNGSLKNNSYASDPLEKDSFSAEAAPVHEDEPETSHVSEEPASSSVKDPVHKKVRKVNKKDQQNV